MLKSKKLFVSDMDGTFYLGDKLLPGSLDFAIKVRDMGARLVFLTNNSSRTPDEYIRKLTKMGVNRELFEVYTSGEATVRFLMEKYPGRRVYLLSTPSVREMFHRAGINLVEEDPEVVVLTYDTTIDFGKIRKTALFLRKGAAYVASHPDINCPTEEGLVPDVGSFISLFESSTGRKPDWIIGKPSPTILEMLLEDYSQTADGCVIIGDRLYTDIECGLRAGVDAILVLSGETTPEMVSPDHPYIIANDVGEIAKLISQEFTV